MLHFTQARRYNTRTNPLPLLNTSEEDPFPVLHTGEKVFTRFLGTENLTQHFNSTKRFQAKHSTLNMQHIRVINCQQNTYYHIMHGK